MSASYPLNDVGALAFDYLLSGPRANLLGQQSELAVEVSPDGGVTWFEPPNSRFVVASDGSDPLDPSPKTSESAKGYVWRLESAEILPNGLLNSEGKRAFLSSNGSNPGVILKTFLNEAQARGALPGINHATFNTTTDSAGQPWANQLTVYYEPGLNYLSVLQNLADQGMVDYRMQGRSLYVYNPGTAVAVDRTIGVGQVTFRPGRDHTEAPFRRTWEGVANYAYFAGDNASYEYTNPGADTTWGRREMFISNGSVSDVGTMAVLTQSELSQHDQARAEYTRGLDFARAVHRPFWDYGVGDYVWSAVDGSGVVRLRIRQLTLTVSDHGIVSGNVVLNDRFLEADIRLKRRVEGITNGAQSGTGTGGPNVPPGTDSVAPAKVVGVSGSSVAYLGPGGFVQAQVSLSWSPVTTNVDGTPITDFDHYEIFRRPFGSTFATDLRMVATSTDTVWDNSPYVAGSSWWFSVKAVDTSGNRSALSAEAGVGMAQDATPPQAPSAPTVTARLGILSVYYNGNPVSGSWPPDLDHIEVHQSTVNNFTPTPASQSDTLYGEGASVVSGAAYGVPLFFKLVAVDKAGLSSVPSAQGTGTPARLVGSDVSADAITYNQIAFKDPGNVVADGSGETSTFQATVAARSNGAWSTTSGAAFHGLYSWTLNAATSPATDRFLLLMATDEVQQIKAGEKLFCRFAYRSSVGSTGSPALVVTWVAANGTLTSSSVFGATKDGAWQQNAAQLTAPANVASFRIHVAVGVSGTTGTHWVDAVEVRRTVGTAFIEDAAITNALINNLAVNSAKIADLDVGKLTAGTLAADVLVASRLMTASSGNRVEMSGTGIRMFKGSVVSGHWNPTYGQLRIYATSDASHTSTGHGIQFGDDDGTNLIIDNNEIMSRFNGTYSTLFMNREGGSVLLGGKQGGFNPDLSDVGQIPQDDDHRVVVQANLEITNVREGGYGVLYPPFMIGPRTRQHIWADTNEIGCATGSGAAAPLYIQSRYENGTDHAIETVLGSNSLFVRRIFADSAGIGGWSGPTVGLQFYQSELRVTNSAFNNWAQIRASAFVVTTSDPAMKRDVTEFDALAILKAAPAKRWQYTDGIEAGDVWHYGPMADTLPADLIRPTDDGLRGYDVASWAGIQGEAIRQLLARVEALEGRG